ncbi:hypothetical protein FB639_004807, partial [Coemansia asiatica]
DRFHLTLADLTARAVEKQNRCSTRRRPVPAMLRCRRRTRRAATMFAHLCLCIMSCRRPTVPHRHPLQTLERSAPARALPLRSPYTYHVTEVPAQHSKPASFTLCIF